MAVDNKRALVAGSILFALPSVCEWVLIWWKPTNVSVEQQWIERALMASAVEEAVGEYLDTKQPMKLFAGLWCLGAYHQYLNQLVFVKKMPRDLMA